MKEGNVRISEGINIYNRSWEDHRVPQPAVDVPGGVYMGGDLSVGGGQVIGRLVDDAKSSLSSDVKENLDRLLKKVQGKSRKK